MSILLNVWMSANNILSIVPIYKSYTKKDYITTGTIGFVSFMSVISHLAENHKHGMLGIGWRTNTSYILNKLDVAGSIMVIVRFAYLYYNKYGTIIPKVRHRSICLMSLFAVIFMKISEYDKYNDQLRSMYIIFHSIWHLSIYPIMNKFLTDSIYI